MELSVRRSTALSRAPAFELVFRVALGLTFMSALLACEKDPRKNEVSVTDASATLASAGVPTPADTASVATVARPPDERDEGSDGGADGGRDGGAVKRRRLITTVPDGGGVETQPASPPSAESAVAPVPHGKPPRPGMGNEEPYGTSAASGAPTLKKTPLPSDDPWQKTPPTSSR